MGEPATYFERLEGQVAVGSPSPLWEIIAESFLRETERVLEGDLVKDYVELENDLPFVRGRVLALRSARSFYRGSLSFAVRYEESSVDTPLNRTLRAAAWRLFVNPLLEQTRFRSRARVILSRMEGVGELRSNDLRMASIKDRRVVRYREAFQLARLILSGTTLTWENGPVRAGALLIKTPQLIEDGIRTVLEEGLVGRWSMRKKERTYYRYPESMSVNPDLEFDFPHHAVGDVKYRVSPVQGLDYWTDRGKKASLYQSVAFAVGCEVTDACVVDFSSKPVSPVTADFDAGVQIGTIRVRRLVWDATRSPAEAEDLLVRQALHWLEDISRIVQLETSEVLVS